MKRVLIQVPALALALAGGVASAQEPAPALPTPEIPTTNDLPTGSADQANVPLLTFGEAIELARKNNHAIKADRATLAAAQTQTETAWSSLLPTVVAQGKYTRNYRSVAFPPNTSGMGFGGPNGLLLQPLNQFDAAISGTTPLIAPAAWAALKAVNANVDAAEANFEAQEAQLLVQVGEAFLAAAGTDELVETRRSSVVVARATLRDAKVRFDAGSVTKVDVARAETAVVRTEQQLLEAITNRNQSYRTLSTLLQTDKAFRVSTDFPTAPMPDPNNVKMALQLRPEYRSLDMTMRAAAEEARARGWQWAPTLSAFGNARVFNYDNFALDRHSWAAGAQLDWVLFDGGARDAQRHAATARAHAAQEQAAVFADRVRDDLANTSADLRTKQKGVEAAQKAVSLSNESLDLIRTQYTLGTATQLDLLEAQDALIGANVALVRARFDVAASDLAFRYAAGTFPPKAEKK